MPERDRTWLLLCVGMTLLALTLGFGIGYTAGVREIQNIAERVQ